MLYRILKADLLKRKGVNIILYIFISIATLFLASSVNNILVVSSAVDYYLDYAKIPDLQFQISSITEKGSVEKWLLDEQEQGFIQGWDSTSLRSLSEKAVQIEHKGERRLLDVGNASLHLGIQDSNYNLVFDEDGNSFDLKLKEIALPLTLMKRNGAEVGDLIYLQLGGEEKQFRIAYQMKDGGFGSGMMGLWRMVVHEEDFHHFYSADKTICLFNVTTNQLGNVQERMEQQNFASLMSSATYDTIVLMYAFEMMIAALCIALGICFILIALLVLRFTILFTIEEQFQEIGIMKVIGFRDFAIKRFYLLKYFVMVFLGAFTGFFLSIPVSEVSMNMVASSMILQSTNSNIMSNIMCSCFVIILVLLYCYACTRKLDKVSAITAIRGGHSGERFHKSRGLLLSRRKHMAMPVYLGLNDILCDFKRFMLLLITFCISFIIITIPINTLNTMRNDDMIRKFGMDPDSVAFPEKIEASGDEKYRSFEQLRNALTRVENELDDLGYEAKLKATAITFLSFHDVEEVSASKIMTLQYMNDEDGYVNYSQGSAPQLENEIAVSEAVLKEKRWEIGNSIVMNIGGEEKLMIITGTYTDYIQLGRSARLNSLVDASKEWLLDYRVMVDIDTQLSQSELAMKLNDTMPAYDWQLAQDIVDESIGGVQKTLQQAVLPLTGILCAIIMLITLLMEKLFLTREKGEIAMLKSSGFNNKTLRNWHIVRTLLVVITAMIIAIPMSYISNQCILKPLFAIMGADMEISIVAWQVYGVFPAILCIAIYVATYFASASIKKINIQELNNIE